MINYGMVQTQIWKKCRVISECQLVKMDKLRFMLIYNAIEKCTGSVKAFNEHLLG